MTIQASHDNLHSMRLVHVFRCSGMFKSSGSRFKRVDVDDLSRHDSEASMVARNQGPYTYHEDN